MQSSLRSTSTSVPYTTLFRSCKLWKTLERRLRLKVERVSPILTLSGQKNRFGENLWQSEPDKCCHIRKVLPLKKYLSNKEGWITRSEEHTSELQSRGHIVCSLLSEVHLHPFPTRRSSDLASSGRPSKEGFALRWSVYLPSSLCLARRTDLVRIYGKVNRTNAAISGKFFL